MKKYDRESNTRVWEGRPSWLISALMAAFSLYCIIDTVFLTTLTEIRLPVFVGLILLLGFLTFPARKGDERVNHLPWYDRAADRLRPRRLLLLCRQRHDGHPAVQPHHAGTPVHDHRLHRHPGADRAVPPLRGHSHSVRGRRAAGVHLRQPDGNRELTADQLLLTLSQVIRTMFYTANGIFGGPISVCAKFIVVFIIFGAFLERTGIAKFFISLANAVAGAAPGGPAKVAVISSALCGMVSGSSVGNTVTTGSVTIPMMKKTGYKGEFAGAVEAAASTGGQIMPPIMGAAAFLMAEFTGEPYSKIAVRAILPAVLYFTGIYIAVHLEAKKLGLKGIPRDQLPTLGQLMPSGSTCCSPWCCWWCWSPPTPTPWPTPPPLAIVATVVVSLPDIIVDASSRQGARDPLGLRHLRQMIFGALEGGAKGSITVAVACGVAGVISGCITVTGLASKLLSAIVSCGRRPHDGRPGADHAVLHRAGHGRAHHRQLLHHGGHLRPHPDGPLHRRDHDGGPLLRVLLRHRGGHHPAGGPGGLCRQRHRQGGPHEDRHQRHQAGHCRLHRAVHLRLSPQMLFVDVTSAFQVVQICISALLGIFGVAAALNGFLYRPDPGAAAGGDWPPADCAC